MSRCRLCGGDHATEACNTELRSRAAAEDTAPAAAVVAQAATGPELGVDQSVGSYRLTRQIGEGASAKVFLAEHGIIGSKVAVKALRPSLHRYPEMVRRFVGEARATNLVRHDNIIQIHDIGVHQERQYYFVMEYLQGATLGARMKSGPMGLEAAAPILLQICDALHAAHARGVVHRDLKPDNVYLVARGDREQVKIVDFGIARRANLESDEQRTTVGTILGTALYMAPEQAESTAVDGRADIYSLGVIMYQLATGQVPFEAKSVPLVLLAHAMKAPTPPRSIHPAVSLAWEQVILTCLAKAPANRFQSMADLGRGLVQAQKEEFAAVPTKPVVLRLPTPVPAHPARFAASFDARVEAEDGHEVGRGTISDISAGGAFVSTSDPLPPVFTRVRIHVTAQGVPRAIPGEIVRVEQPAEGEVGARRGIAVQFDASDPAALAAVEPLLGAAAPLKPTARAGDDAAARLIAHLEAKPRDDYYALLNVAPHADAAKIADAAERLTLEMDDAHFPGLTDGQQRRLRALSGRLAQANEVLLDPSSRASYDADRGNFVGVARCIGAGLAPEAMARLRQAFLKRRPEAESAARPHVARADEAELAGNLDRALASLTAALEADPLDINLQRRFWHLRRRQKERSGPASGTT